MDTDRTLEQIRRDGLAALRERLGVVGMVRFLQQYEHGSGDWATERHEWVDRTSLDDLRKELRRLRAARKRRKAG
jgi:hypothetical protein